jgi:hypothetical protein
MLKPVAKLLDTYNEGFIYDYESSKIVLTYHQFVIPE